MTVLEISDPLAMADLSAFTSLAHRADSDGARATRACVGRVEQC